MKLFNLIREKCGQNHVQSFRKLETLSKQHARHSNHLRFNLRCKHEGIIPRSLNIQSPIKSKGAMEIIDKAKKQLLRERISLNVKKVDNIVKDIEKSQNEWLSNPDLNEEIRSAAVSHLAVQRENTHLSTKTRHIGKMEKLVEKQKAAKYNGLTAPTELDLSGTQLKRWVINRSSRPLTDTETRFLARGLGHAITPDKIPHEEFILATESACKMLPPEERPSMRAEIAGILRSAKPPKPNISREEREAAKTLAKDDSILILPADKGRCTVILDKPQYIDQVETMLSDKNTYSPLATDPTHSVHERLIKILRRLNKQKKV